MEVLIVYAVLWAVLYGIPIFVLSMRAELSSPRVAFIPLVGLANVARAGGNSGWIILLRFIPLLNWILMAWLWAAAAIETGQSSALGWLTLIPLLNLILYWVIAFNAKPGGYSGKVERSMLAAGGNDYAP